MTKPIRYQITSDMTESDLWALKKNAQKGDKYFILKLADEKYPDSKRKIHELPYMVGINGEIIFTK